MFILSGAESETLSLSLWVAGWAVLCSLPFGIAVAWLLARRSFPGKIIVDGLVHLPLILPPVALGYGLLVLFGRHGIVGGWFYEHAGLSIAFRWQGASVAAAVMAFPLMVRAIRLSMESVDRGLEAAAATLGANPWRIFRTITLPLAAPGILSGTILAFARSLGEFGATITFVSNIPGQTRTLPLALYSALQSPGQEGEASRLCIISVLLSFTALLASELIARRLHRRCGLKHAGPLAAKTPRRPCHRRGFPPRWPRRNGFVRRSGAGKTSILQMLAGLLPPIPDTSSSRDTHSSIPAAR